MVCADFHRDSLGRGRQTTVGLSTTAVFSIFAGYFWKLGKVDHLRNSSKKVYNYTECRQAIKLFSATQQLRYKIVCTLNRNGIRYIEQTTKAQQLDKLWMQNVEQSCEQKLKHLNWKRVCVLVVCSSLVWRLLWMSAYTFVTYLVNWRDSRHQLDWEISSS